MLKPLAMSLAMLLSVPSAAAEDAALTLARAIMERPANEGRVGDMVFDLTTATGASRNRRALMIHSDTEGLTRIGIFFKAPAAIADTAFLSHEPSAGAGENWLYLPATDRVRRLPSSERGSYFMGTDLTYGDIKDNFRFGLEDWDFSGGIADPATGLLQLHGKARTPDIGKQLGYSRFYAEIDPKTLFPLRVRYEDTAGTLLKEVEILEKEQIGGAWTAMRFQVRNLQSGHTTKVHFENMRHVPSLDDRYLTSAQLARGAPTIR